MNNFLPIYEIKQELNETDVEYLVTREREMICFFRFLGGNPSETEEVIKQLYRLKESPMLLFIVFRFPFRFEGKSRMDTAIEQYYKLKDLSDGMIYFYSDGMMDMLEEDTSIKEAKQIFEEFEKAPIDGLKEMVHETGEMNIDIQDIKTFIKNNNKTLFIRTFEGHSFDEPLKYLISAPYLPKDFADGNQLIINIGYAQEVDMNAFRQINLRLNDLFHKAEIFKLGSHLIEESGTKLKITIMANGISDPFSRPDDMKQSPYYRYWMLDKIEKLGKQSKWFSALMKKS